MVERILEDHQVHTIDIEPEPGRFYRGAMKNTAYSSFPTEQVRSILQDYRRREMETVSRYEPGWFGCTGELNEIGGEILELEYELRRRSESPEPRVTVDNRDLLGGS